MSFFNTYIRDQAFLQRFDFASAENYTNQLEEIRDYLESSLAASDTIQSQTRYRNLIAQVDEELRPLYARLKTDLESDNRIASQFSYEITNKAFENAGVEIKQTFDAIPFDALKMLISITDNITLEGYEQTDRKFKPSKEIDKLMRQHSKEYKKALRLSIAEGLGIDDTVKLFRELTEDTDNLKTHQVNALTRTTIAEAMQRTKEYTNEKNFSDVIEGYQWVTTLDNRTSKICASKAGQIKKKLEDFPIRPPAHINCRSQIVPFGEFDDPKTMNQRARTWQQKIVATDRGEIKSQFKLKTDKVMDIQVPKQSSKFTSFDVFFKQMSKQDQINWLGPQRYKMYQSGKLGMKQLLDGQGRIRTVKELANLIGIKKEGLQEIRRRDKQIKAKNPQISTRAASIQRKRRKLNESK